MIDFNQAALICVDWGSSNLRAYLIDMQGNVLARLQSDKGVLNFSAGQYGPELSALLQPWLSVKSVPVMLAGMVGSAQGWQDAGYVACPATLTDLAQNLSPVVNSVANGEQLQAYIVPGVKGLSNFGQIDVMRGEEVQIFGALLASKRQLAREAQKGQETEDGQESPSVFDSQLVCLPGTHSKWAKVTSGGNESDSHGASSITQFSTYMTGELFALLNTHSILGKMYQHAANTNNADAFDGEAFDEGVKTARAPGSLLHKLFSARSKVLNKELQASGVHSYLSGMLIATEVFDMLSVYQSSDISADEDVKAEESLAPIIIVGAPALSKLYQRVMATTAFSVHCIDAEVASCLGILNIANVAGKL
ncbi:2-dehydro-3-deoxygalactonokinase [Paraglaciecola sp. 20A4]|uniref:2-dehydro-3-deoxygalactonokinase n=1 Tax=Paraglaciecola sp. 20A4 TaxID=2687288 RepID=UPI00140BF839|nr:2-dehydro-3-deoxygalactonokinase [Paraglaciecola sp. 20A4]